MDPSSGKKKNYVRLGGNPMNSALKNATEIDTYGHINLSLALFVMMVALHVVNFVYLFSSKTEYLSWIFAFILNILFPISWAMDLMKYPNGTYKYYLTGCLILGIVFEFIALLIILTTNSIIQKRITDHEKKKRLDNSGDPTITVPNDTVYDKTVNTISGIIAEIVTANYWLKAYFTSSSDNSKNNKKPDSDYKVPEIILSTNEINKKLYTTTAVLIIASVSSYFVNQTNYEIEKGYPPKSTLGNNIQWWLSLIPQKIEDAENLWKNVLTSISIDPFIRFFFLFCGGFSAFFFSFVRISPIFSEITDEYIKEQGLKGYVFSTNFDTITFPDIYNQSAGPVNFQLLVAFFFGILMFIIFPFLATIFNIKSVTSFVLLENPSILTIILYVGWLSLFILPFIHGISNPVKLGVTNTNTNNLLIVIIGFLFAVLGTPVLFMVFEFLMRLFGQPLSRYLKQGWWYDIKDDNLLTSVINNLPFTSGRAFSDPYNWIMIFITFTFFGLWAGIMVYGIKDNWLVNGGNGKTIKFIMIFLISMITGWILAFSPYLNIISILINIALVPIKIVIFIFAPIAILALSITQFVLALKAKKAIGIESDG